MKASVGLNQNAPTVPSSLFQQVYIMLVLVIVQLEEYSINALQKVQIATAT